jgi:hypothetical protein
MKQAEPKTRTIELVGGPHCGLVATVWDFVNVYQIQTRKDRWHTYCATTLTTNEGHAIFDYCSDESC